MPWRNTCKKFPFSFLYVHYATISLRISKSKECGRRVAFSWTDSRLDIGSSPVHGACNKKICYVKLISFFIWNSLFSVVSNSPYSVIEREQKIKKQIKKFSNLCQNLHIFSCILNCQSNLSCIVIFVYLKIKVLQQNIYQNRSQIMKLLLLWAFNLTIASYGVSDSDSALSIGITWLLITKKWQTGSPGTIRISRTSPKSVSRERVKSLCIVAYFHSLISIVVRFNKQYHQIIAKFINSQVYTMKRAAVYLFAGIAILALSVVTGMENNIIISKGYVSKLCIDRCQSSVMTQFLFLHIIFSSRNFKKI